MTDRVPYQRGILDAISDPKVETVVIMSSSQIGKTEIILNLLGYYIHQDPSPMLFVNPTLEMAITASKDRIAPMIRDSPVLESLVQHSKAKTSESTLLQKNFPGGHLTLAGSNSPASLASRPVRIVCCDEVDRYPVSSGSEGDAVMLAAKRATTFRNRKIILTSTPTIKGASRIEAAYEASDKRIFKVPCPECGHRQRLLWKGVKWKKGGHQDAVYVCEECNASVPQVKQPRMVAQGEWVPTSTEGEPRTVGFHISELYSPWRTWGDMATDFLFANRSRDTLQVWINTSLGESWEVEEGDAVDYEYIYARREHYGVDPLPEGVRVIVAGVDCQGDRLECEILGVGDEEECWSLEYHVIRGDPGVVTTWKKLDKILDRKFPLPSGVALNVAATCIDSGGHHTQAVYDYTRRHTTRHAVKGGSVAGKPLVSKPSRTNKGRVLLYSVGTEAAKDLIYARLRIAEEGPGYCHFPMKYDREYCKGLCSERKAKTISKGVVRYQWKQARDRNEPLDVRVYALAAFRILNVNMKKVSAKIEGKKAGETERRETVAEQDIKQERQEIETMRKEVTVRRRKRPAKRRGFGRRW